MAIDAHYQHNSQPFYIFFPGRLKKSERIQYTKKITSELLDSRHLKKLLLTKKLHCIKINVFYLLTCGGDVHGLDFITLYSKFFPFFIY